MGRKQKTKHEGSTADPCFYQTVEFHEMLPGDLRFAPEIRIEVSVSEAQQATHTVLWYIGPISYVHRHPPTIQKTSVTNTFFMEHPLHV